MTHLSHLSNSLRSVAFSLLLLSAAQPGLLRAQQDQTPQLRINQTPMTEAQLNVLNSPDFLQRFAESYAAETDVEPRLTEQERGVIQQIIAKISANELDAAVQLLNAELAASTTASPVFDFTLGNLQYQRGEADAAVTSYKNALTKFPRYRRAWKNLAIIQLRQNALEDATVSLTKCIELGEHTALTYGLLGFCYATLGSTFNAETAYRNAMMLDAANSEWPMGLARVYFQQERFTEVVYLTNLLTQKDPNKADVWLLQANAFIAMKEPLQAAQIYERVDLMGGSTIDTLNLLADIYVNEELFDLAANSFSRALELDPKQSPERVLRGAQVLAFRGALPETRELITKIETTYGTRLLIPEQKALLKLKGRLAEAEKNTTEEAHVLEQIIELDPLDGDALILLGQLTNRLGDSEKAIALYQRAAAIPDYEADAKVSHAQLLVGLNRHAEALPLLRRAQEIRYKESVQELLEEVERVTANP